MQAFTDITKLVEAFGLETVLLIHEIQFKNKKQRKKEKKIKVDKFLVNSLLEKQRLQEKLLGVH